MTAKQTKCYCKSLNNPVASCKVAPSVRLQQNQLLSVSADSVTLGQFTSISYVTRRAM